MPEILERPARPADLRRLAGAALLDRGALERALQLAGGRPTAASWYVFTRFRLLLIGVLLLVSGVIFFVAANWADIPPRARIALVAAAMILATAAAARLGLDALSGRVAALGAGLLFGPLAAVYGQVYQTGADSWGLFATWTVVMTAFAFASRFAGAWIAALTLFHVAAFTFWSQRMGEFFEHLEPLPLLAFLALVDALLLAGLESLAARAKSLRRLVKVATPVLTAFALALLTWPAFIAIVDDDAPEGARLAALVLAVLAIGATFYYYLRKNERRGTFMLVAACVAAVTLLTTAWTRFLIDGLDVDSSVLLLLVGVVLSAQVVLVTRGLLAWRRGADAQNLSEEPDETGETPREPEKKPSGPSLAEVLERAGAPELVVDEEPRRRTEAALEPGEEADTPWFLRFFIAFGTWIAALLVGSFLLALDVFEKAPTAAVAGLFLATAATLIARRLPENVVTTQLTWITAIAGELSFLMAVERSFGSGDEAVWVTSTLAFLQVVMLIAVPYRLFRVASAAMLVIALDLWILAAEVTLGLDFLVILTAFIVVALWLGEAWGLTSPARHAWRPVAFGLTAGWLAPLVSLTLARQLGIDLEVEIFSAPFAVTAALAFCGLFVLRAAFSETRRALASRAGIAAVAGFLLLAVLLGSTPGVLAGIVLLLLSHLRRDRGLEALAFLYLAFFLSVHYYSLEMPLLEKSAWILASGALLLAAAALLRRLLGRAHDGTNAARATLGRQDTARLGVALALALLLIGVGTADKELILARGQTVLLELAPRDPRSLMQGDYMVLRYRLARQLELDELPRQGHLVLRLDERGVGSFVELWDGRELAPDEQLLFYRLRGSRWDRLRLGAESFFFEEGQAEAFAGAEYGELRVDADGDAVLVGLRGADLEPLP